MTDRFRWLPLLARLARAVVVPDAIPPELHPCIDYAAHELDPDGHCIQLYHAMEQIGWDGKSRPHELHRRANSLEEAVANPVGAAEPALA